MKNFIFSKTGLYSIRFLFLLLLVTGVSTLEVKSQSQDEEISQREVAEYVRTQILDGEFGNRTLWMTEGALDQSHVARSLIKEKNPDLEFPFERTWLVMIDDNPDANFGHDVRWVFIDADLSKHLDPIKKSFPPIVLSDKGEGSAVSFQCTDLTKVDCPDTGSQLYKPLNPDLLLKIYNRGCLYAVLVSGGISTGSNFSRYPQNLKSMYQLLRSCGYPKSNIFTYYADGSSPLDMDNLDGDNNDNTGSDITGGAIENLIRTRIQTLCTNLDPKRDILFTYFTNHGADNTGVCLWDLDNNGLDATELYSPTELASDCSNCKVCRHYMIHDQCFAGDFLPMASDGLHGNLVVYAAANATEFSWGREYMAQWETNNPGTTTMNAMHQDVVNNGNLTSTPGMQEGTPNYGNRSACKCCCTWYLFWRCIWWRWWYWIIIPIIIIVPWVMIRRP